jgi:hypothetical protein
MSLNDLFRKTDAYWVRYDDYAYREHGGELFLLPTVGSNVSVYDPLKVADALIVDALNIGLLCIRKQPLETKKEAIRDFAVKYGLLGFMTALPTTPDFTDYDYVYLPKNRFIKTETMDANAYVDMFFPFDKPGFLKTANQAEYHVMLDHNDREQTALALTFGDSSMALNMETRRGYGERYEWLSDQFIDWAYSLCAATFYYEEKDETERELHRRAMKAFGGIAPHYRVALYGDKPTLVWDFHSLLQTIQIIFSFALTDGERPIRICKNCSKAFLAQDARSLYCSPACKNKYNVGKSRNKREDKP